MEIIAHRGASYDAPENTVAAAYLAWMQGADAVEVDLHLTMDGRLAVIHDDNLKRVAQSTVRVKNSALDALRQHDVGRWKNPRFSNERIPALDDILATVPPGRRIFLELKSGLEAIPELRRTLARYDHLSGRVVVISFDLPVATQTKVVLPGCEVYWILDAPLTGAAEAADRAIRRCRDARLDGLDLGAGWPIDADFTARVHGERLKLYVWTVDDAVKARELRRAGVDGVATNRPGWLRGEIGE